MGLLIFLCFAIGASALLFEAAVRHKESSASTPEEMERAVLKRLERKYRAAGVRDAEEAARDHVSNMVQIEKFKRWACAEYVERGTSLSDMRAEWISDHHKRVRKLFGNDPRHQRAARAFELALSSTTADEIFTHGEAKAKWEREVAAAMRVSHTYSEADAHVINGLFAAGNRL